MSHQPFEDLILGGEALTLEQRKALDAHQAVCPACADLAASLGAVEQTLREAESVAPRPGFALRLERRLAARQVRDARRQAWGIFAVATTAAALLIGPMAWQVGAGWTSPGEMLVQMLIRVYDLWAGLHVASGFTRAVVSNLADLVPPAWVLGFLAACLGLGMLWLVTLYRFAFRRVKEGART